jgi:hypothetical protein
MRRRKNTIHPETLSHISYRARKKKPRVSLWSIIFNSRVSYSKKIVPTVYL